METYPTVPRALVPADGRFGSGPSRIRPEQIARLSRPLLMGTSHRQEPITRLVASIRSKLSELFSLPPDYEVVLGNGGATAFWDIAATSLIRERAACACFGAFGAKFATEIDKAPHLASAIRVEGEAGTLSELSGDERSNDGGVPDVFAYPHHETSTGVLSPLRRFGGEDALTLVDATSIAGAVSVDVSRTDAYYFSPQKAFGSDGGLWIALLSPLAQERAALLHEGSGRWMPCFLDLSLAIAHSKKNQTLNTPAIATLLMIDEQLNWMLTEGGLEAMESRCRQASDLLYEWADNSSVVTPFVADPAVRSPVVVTLEFDAVIDAKALAASLRTQGIVDIDPYRGVGGNQLRIATWPATPVEDIAQLISCVDWILEHVL